MVSLSSITKDVDRLYLPRKSGGRGLINVWQLVAVKNQALKHYVYKNTLVCSYGTVQL